MAYVEEKLTKELPTHPSFNEDVGDGNIYYNHNKLDNSSSLEETANNDCVPGKESEETIHLPTLNDEHDGGYGWLVVLGAFMVQITSFGVISSWGVMQDFFNQTLFKDNEAALIDLSFVGTLSLICVNGFSPIVQVAVSRFGLRPVMILGTIFIVIALEMASLATEIWHLYLTQGVLFGVGASCMYVTVMAVTPQWFTKNRGIALGIVAGGSGVGGLVVPFIITPLNRNFGHGWTYRILGFICLVCDIIACVFVKERVASPQKKKNFRQILQFDVLKNTDFLIFAIGSDIALFGYFVPLFFIPAYATYLGLSDSQGSSIISVCSAMNCIGRLVVGYLADRIGKLNANIIFQLITAASCLLIWTFAFDYPAMMGFGIVYGFACGSYFALMSPISVEILGMEKFPSGLSLLLLFNLFPVFGSNIASAIEAGLKPTPFLTYKLFPGVAYLTGSLVLVYLKFRRNKNPFAKI
ncbi:major facilitator superfamily domain-containing protein [Pilaira anomala]|nr:major facilitator superfamily domain-containing protein [Pilaira anomala]